MFVFEAADKTCTSYNCLELYWFGENLRLRNFFRINESKNLRMFIYIVLWECFKFYESITRRPETVKRNWCKLFKIIKIIISKLRSMIRHIETSHRHQKMGSKSSVNFLEVTINGTASNSCLISCFYNISDT